MTSPQEPPPGLGPDDAVDVRAEALDVIFDAHQWRLATAQWGRIERMLDAMISALEADDLSALAAVTADLELAGPLRITRIGTVPAVPPPPPVRDQLNRLVHILGEASAVDRREPDDDATSDS